MRIHASALVFFKWKLLQPNCQVPVDVVGCQNRRASRGKYDGVLILPSIPDESHVPIGSCHVDLAKEVTLI